MVETESCLSPLQPENPFLYCFRVTCPQKRVSVEKALTQNYNFVLLTRQATVREFAPRIKACPRPQRMPTAALLLRALLQAMGFQPNRRPQTQTFTKKAAHWLRANLSPTHSSVP